MAKVELQNITKRFQDETVALHNFNLTIKDGEFVVLVGPSGCGKSTTLRILAGLEQPTGGEVFINDTIVTTQTPQERNVAMVFQNYALYPHMTVRGNLEFPLKMMKTPIKARRQNIIAIADILNLANLLERKPSQLSGGERQRVAMGRALVRDPSVFLLDEPLSNLDAKLRSQIRADIIRIQKTLNKTTLYVTHDQVEAMTLGDRVVVMNEGKLQQADAPAKLYQKPCNIFAARFIGSPGMNIVPGQLNRADKKDVSVVDAEQILLFKIPASLGITHSMDQQIHVGIRPESLKASYFKGSISLLVFIDSIEFLGHESLVYFRLRDAGNCSKATMIARFPGQFQQPETLYTEFFFNPDEIYFFDKNGEAIPETTVRSV